MGRAHGGDEIAQLPRRGRACTRSYVEVQIAPPEDHEGHPSCGEGSEGRSGCGSPWLETLHTVLLWSDDGGETLAEYLCHGCAYELAGQIADEHGLAIRVTSFGRSRS